MNKYLVMLSNQKNNQDTPKNGTDKADISTSVSNVSDHLVDTQVFNSDLIQCEQCKNLSMTGRCEAAQRRDIQTIPPYYPNLEIKQRCYGYEDENFKGSDIWSYCNKKRTV